MEEFDEADNVVENDTFLGLSVVYKSFSSLSQVTLQSTYLVAHEHDDDNILRTRTNDTQHNVSIMIMMLLELSGTLLFKELDNFMFPYDIMSNKITHLSCRRDITRTLMSP
ncbi:hypothetical protein YC2023_036127 [Brassica napus]